ALPAEHDDDHGGDARCRPARDRVRGRLGAAAAARHLDRGRSACQPNAYALHDAGGVHLSRPVPALVQGSLGAQPWRPETERPSGGLIFHMSEHRAYLSRSIGWTALVAAALVAGGGAVGPGQLRAARGTP